MKVVVTAMGSELNADVSPVFGRCPVYVFIDTETMELEALPNPAMSAPGGAGVQAAQFVAGKGAQAVLTGQVGPNAFNALQAAGITVCPVSGGTVQQAIEAYKSGTLRPISAPTSGMHAGMGTGRGMGRGMGGGMGMGPGMWGAPPMPTGRAAGAQAEELSELKSTAQSLKDQLDQVFQRIDRLENKE